MLLFISLKKELKNNQSTIINLQDHDKNGSHWVSYKKINNEIFYFDSYAV